MATRTPRRRASRDDPSAGSASRSSARAKRSTSRNARALEALRSLPQPLDAIGVDTVAAALDTPDALVFELAARIAGRSAARRFVGPLRAGFDRFLVDGADRDPGCRAKFAAVEALRALNDADLDVYRIGARTRQLEKAWGPPNDTAAPLRALCARAMVACSALDALDVLADHLADPEWPVRAAAAASIGDLGRAGGAPLLRYKLRVGDLSPDVVAACYGALDHLDAESALDVAGDLLASPEVSGAELRETIGLALAETRRAGAEAPLLAWWARSRFQEERRVALSCAAMLRTPESFAALLALVRESGGHDARDVVLALAPYALTASAREGLLDAARANEASTLLAFAEEALEA